MKTTTAAAAAMEPVDSNITSTDSSADNIEAAVGIESESNTKDTNAVEEYDSTRAEQVTYEIAGSIALQRNPDHWLLAGDNITDNITDDEITEAKQMMAVVAKIRLCIQTSW